jgi:hypothetical protein
LILIPCSFEFDAGDVREPLQLGLVPLAHFFGRPSFSRFSTPLVVDMLVSEAV